MFAAAAVSDVPDLKIAIGARHPLFLARLFRRKKSIAKAKTGSIF
jgi:hypothetical protein